MIESIRIQDFKGHRDTTVRLGRLTVLVGPNGSGKTSVLEALRLQRDLWNGDKASYRDFLRRGVKTPIVIDSTGIDKNKNWKSSWSLGGKPIYSGRWQCDDVVCTARLVGTDIHHEGDVRGLLDAARILARTCLFKFHAARIGDAAYSDQPGAPVESDGTNTAVALAALKLGYDEIFERIEHDIRIIIPSVERVRIRQETVQRPQGDVVGSKIYFDFRGASGVPAHCASEGTLITLALLTVLHGPNRPNLILLDDFDQSLHPQAQMELVTLIKRLLDEFPDVQIVATTHSPYILDQLDPADVHAFALRDDGTVATRPLSEHPEIKRMKGALTTGQIWTLDQERLWVLEGQTP